MRILLVTDAWHPQVNGVAYTWSYIINLIKKEHEVFVLNPYVEGSEPIFKIQGSIPIIKNANHIAEKFFERYKPDKVHIATEGSLGLAMRQYCIRNGISYNTSYHTRLADYGWVLYGVPRVFTWLYIRWFHKYSGKVLVPTKSIANQLALKNSIVWGGGVDTERFKPSGEKSDSHNKTIIAVGRVSKDKNLDDFCKISGYKKILVGDGPYLSTLKSKYPDVEFTGFVPHKELVNLYTKADVFVFPSIFDTFGLVILEAMACGLPVVAYDVPSPSDIVQNGVTGFLGESLERNIEEAYGSLNELSDNARQYAESQSWNSIAEQFLVHLS